MKQWNRLALVVATAVAFTAASCSDDEPTANLSDPAGVAADLDKVDSVFDTEVFESFERTANLMQAGPFATAGALVAATAPRASSVQQQPSVRAALAAKALARLAPQFNVAAPQDSFLPDAVLGTYEWNVATDQYEKTARAGAPANTVRIILYAIDPLTDQPIEPLDEVGYVDLTDNQFVGTGYSLGLTVRDSAGTTTYVDYDITLTGNASGFGANATGYVANGTGRQLDFSVQFLATGNDSVGTVSVDATFDVNAPSIGVEVHDAVSFDSNSITINRDFRIARGAESIRVTGTLTITETSPNTFSLTVSITIRVNGGVWVTIQGTDAGITVQQADGTQLTQAELAALGRILDQADEFLDDIEDLFEPAEILTGL
jgi:hypothetical protein